MCSLGRLMNNAYFETNSLFHEIILVIQLIKLKDIIFGRLTTISPTPLKRHYFDKK